MTCPIDPSGRNMCIERLILDFAMIGAQANTTCDILVSASPTGRAHERPVPCIHDTTYYVRPTQDQVDRWNADADGKIIKSLLSLLNKELELYGKAS